MATNNIEYIRDCMHIIKDDYTFSGPEYKRREFLATVVDERDERAEVMNAVLEYHEDDWYYTEKADGALEAVYNALTGDDKISWEVILRSICKRENRMDIWDDEDDLPTIVDRLIDECDIRITRV